MWTTDDSILWLTLLIFNGSTIWAIRHAVPKLDIEDAVKIPVEAPLLGKGVGADQTDRDVSFSRVSGMIGATVLATFFWAVGNVVIYKLVAAPSQVKDVLDHLGAFVLSGSSLFAPYGVKLVTEAFKGK